MKRLFFIADEMAMVEPIADALYSAGISAWNFHVISKDDAGMYCHPSRSTSPLHRIGVMRGSTIGALCGFLVGLFAAIAAVLLLPLSLLQNLVLFAAATFTPTLIGSWLGAMVGRALQDRQIARFYNLIEHGHVLLIIDVDRMHRPKVEQLLRSFPIRTASNNVAPASIKMRCA
jgi:hypothetical protein